MTEEQIYLEIDRSITDALNRQNTAAVLRALLKLMYKNAIRASGSENGDVIELLKQLPGYGANKQLRTNADGDLVWGTTDNGYVGGY